MLSIDQLSIYDYTGTDRKKINQVMINTGIRMGIEYLMMYPKKDGISIPISSAMDLTIKFGPLPIYEKAPKNTAPIEMAFRSIIEL